MRLTLLCTILLAFLSVNGQRKALVISKAVSDSVMIFSDTKNKDARLIIDTVRVCGNKVTKEFIILRELTFNIGDTISAYQLPKKLTRSRENLLNTSLFNFVTIHDSVVSEGHFSHIEVHIRFIERWYLWPFPIFELSDRNFNTWWESKDFNRISYGLMLVKENMRGRMEKLNMLLRFGWNETYQISYSVPYINKKQTFGSGIGVGFSQNHEVAYTTQGNKHENVRDDSENIFKNFYAYFDITHRPSLYHHHVVSLRYNYYIFGDTLLQLNPNYSFNGETTNEYLTLHYRFTSDHRDSKVYPLKGDYFEGNLSKSGFGIFKDGDISMMYLQGSYRKYWNVFKRFYFSTDWIGKISTSRNQPFFYQRGLGYGRNYVRGYELYVVDGQSYALSKNTITYNLLPTQVKDVGFIPGDRFGKIHYALYLNLFFDAGYVEDFTNSEGNSLANRILFGTGVGIDLVTYYDMVFRLEFSVSREGESGVFFHVANTL